MESIFEPSFYLQRTQTLTDDSISVERYGLDETIVDAFTHTHRVTFIATTILKKEKNSVQMGYESKVNEEPSQLLLENGLVVSFCVRYDHRLNINRAVDFTVDEQPHYYRIGILTLFISRVYGLGPSHSSTSYYIKSSVHSYLVPRLDLFKHLAYLLPDRSRTSKRKASGNRSGEFKSSIKYHVSHVCCITT